MEQGNTKHQKGANKKMKGEQVIVDYINGIYAAADEVKAGAEIQGAREILFAAEVFSITKKFKRGDDAATRADAMSEAIFWLGCAARARAEDKPASARVYDRTAMVFVRALHGWAA